jgi:hypothetical protein
MKSGMICCGSAGLKMTTLQKIMQWRRRQVQLDWKLKMEEGEACKFMQHIEMKSDVAGRKKLQR